MSRSITTGLGSFSKDKFNALLDVRNCVLRDIRNTLDIFGYTEVTTASLVNIAGSCENPNASFTLNYYGREAHLSQSAQIQLESIVMRLNRGVFTVNNSFREENYEDPSAEGRRLSEFTLIEPEKPYYRWNPDEALNKIIKEMEFVVQTVIEDALARCPESVQLLGGNTKYLQRIRRTEFEQITYEWAIGYLNRKCGKKKEYKFGDDLGIREEQEILKLFNNTPVFIKYHPSGIKFFNMKRVENSHQKPDMPDRVYSVDLLLPKLGETIGGAIREEDGEKIKAQLRESRLGGYLTEKGIDPVEPFAEYFRLFSQEKPMLRGGYGIGFERLIGFLIGSNDILDTITYRTLRPGK